MGELMKRKDELPSAPISKTSCLEYYNSLCPKSITDVIKGNAITLGAIGRTDREKLKAFLVAAIADYVDFINVQKNMSGSQILQTAELLMDEYAFNEEGCFLNAEDVKLCFNMAKKGAFGEVYSRMDGQIIFKFFSAYSSMKMKTCEGIHYDEAMGYKDRNDRVYEEIFDKLTQPK